MQHTVLHVDMDAFFAAVEVVENPSFKGKPLVVGGDPGERHVVSTCSYEARQYGIHSAMPTFEAKRLCPHAIFVNGNHRLYKEYSSKVFEVLYAITHKVQPVSIDEAYLEMSDLVSEKATGKQIARWLRERVKDKTGLTCSVGVASNKLIAKVASSHGKPDGLYEIPHGLEREFLAPLPIRAIPGIGKKTEDVLYQNGIRSIGDLQSFSLEKLLYRYGQRGYQFYLLGQGIDHREVEWWEHPPKSIGAETTFRNNITEKKELESKLGQVFEKAFKRLIRQGMLSRSVTIKIRSHDFKTITRSHALKQHTKNREILFQEARQLLDANFSEEATRLIGISFEKLTDSYWQPLLW